MHVKKPWERRLKDLSLILTNCASTYFDPDIFRMNTNQFLQTARTVTFIIQKNKSSIANFDEWYNSNVLQKWNGNELMQWAKNSRNTIEKQGDLETNSSLKTILMFSYLEEHDIEMDLDCAALLNYGIKKLVRLAQKQLPSGVSDAAVVKIERSWVADTLPNWELLHALSYIYCRIYECCRDLAIHMNSAMDSSIPSMSKLDDYRESARHIQYVKLKGMKSHSIKSDVVELDKNFSPPKHLQELIKEKSQTSFRIDGIDSATSFYSKMAEATFGKDGYHIPMLFLFDHDWNILEMMSTQFDDQSDKFIFWRLIGEKVKSLNVHGMIWICESWKRSAVRRFDIPIRSMPIIGEELSIIAHDGDNNKKKFSWEIVRDNDQNPKLLTAEKNEMEQEHQFFLAPVLRAMGLSDDQIFPNMNQ